MINCNHKHGLMLACRHVHVRPRCFILSEACSSRLTVTYFAGKNLKIDWSIKMPLHWLFMGVAGDARYTKSIYALLSRSIVSSLLCYCVRNRDHCCVLCDVARDLLLTWYIVHQPVCRVLVLGSW